MAPVAEFMDTPETGVPIVNTFVPVPPVLVGAVDVISWPRVVVSVDAPLNPSDALTVNVIP